MKNLLAAGVEGGEVRAPAAGERVPGGRVGSEFDQFVPADHLGPARDQRLGCGRALVGDDAGEQRDVVDVRGRAHADLPLPLGVGEIGVVCEALRHACLERDASLDLRWICAEQIESQGAEALLEGMDAVVVPGGFGNRGVDGKVAAIRWAREQRVPLSPLRLWRVQPLGRVRSARTTGKALPPERGW